MRMISLSSISIATGITPRWITDDTASEAARTLSKIASRVRVAGGRRTRRSVASVTMPSVPSEPTSSPRRSTPGASGTRLPRRTMRPSDSTTSSARMWFTVEPWASVCGPPELFAMFPPMVQTRCEDGSGAYSRPYGASASCRCRLITPGCTTTTRLSASISRMRFIRVSTMSTPPRTGTVPPARPVPEPRGTTGTSWSAAICTAAATSAVVRGKTTASGSARSMVASYS